MQSLFLFILCLKKSAKSKHCGIHCCCAVNKIAAFYNGKGKGDCLPRVLEKVGETCFHPAPAGGGDSYTLCVGDSNRGPFGIKAEPLSIRPPHPCKRFFNI